MGKPNGNGSGSFVKEIGRTYDSNIGYLTDLHAVDEAVKELMKNNAMLVAELKLKNRRPESSEGTDISNHAITVAGKGIVKKHLDQILTGGDKDNAMILIKEEAAKNIKNKVTRDEVIAFASDVFQHIEKQKKELTGKSTQRAH